MENAILNFEISILALVIGIMLFVMYRKYPQYKNFMDSMTMLLLIMAPVGLTIPIISEYKGGMYLFPVFYFLGLTGWLFFTKHMIYGKELWQKERTYKWTMLPWWMLIATLIPGTIVLVVIIPYFSKWALP